MGRSISVLAAALVAAMAAHAQAVDPPIAPPPTIVEPAPRILPAGTIVEVELADALSSRTNHQQDTFALRLAAPIMLSGEIVAPAGAVGGGEVIDAKRSTIGGAQSRLIVSARFLEINGERVRLRSMHIGVAGEDRATASLVAGILVGIPAMFIQGGEIELPAGTRASARLAADVILPPLTPTPTPASATDAPAGVVEGTP